MFVSWIEAEGASGGFSSRYIGLVESICQTARRSGCPLGDAAVEALTLAALSEPGLEVRAVKKRLGAVSKKLAVMITTATRQVKVVKMRTWRLMALIMTRRLTKCKRKLMQMLLLLTTLISTMESSKSSKVVSSISPLMMMATILTPIRKRKAQMKISMTTIES